MTSKSNLPPDPKSKAGIFIAKGMTLSVGGLQFSCDDQGKISGTLKLHVRFDVTPTWLSIAQRRLDEARQCQVARDIAWKGDDEGAKASALEAEFEAAMQSIVASVTALEAFYAIVRPLTEIPDELAAAWKTKRPARSIQVAEVMRYAFRLPQKGVSGLIPNLKEIYKLRNSAVHPSGDIEEAVMQPELGVGVERRFALYRALNAEKVFDCSSWILWELVHHGEPANEKIEKYAVTLRERLSALFPAGHKFKIQNPGV